MYVCVCMCSSLLIILGFCFLPVATDSFLYTVDEVDVEMSVCPSQETPALSQEEDLYTQIDGMYQDPISLFSCSGFNLNSCTISDIIYCLGSTAYIHIHAGITACGQHN